MRWCHQELGGRGATFGTVFSAHAGTEWRTISYPNKLISRWFPMGYEPSGLQFQARLEMVSYCLQTVDFSEWCFQGAATFGTIPLPMTPRAKCSPAFDILSIIVIQDILCNYSSLETTFHFILLMKSHQYMTQNRVIPVLYLRIRVNNCIGLRVFLSI